MTPFSIHDPSIRSPKAACVVVVAAIGGNSSGHAAEKVVFEFCNGNRQTAFVFMSGTGGHLSQRGSWSSLPLLPLVLHRTPLFRDRPETPPLELPFSRTSSPPRGLLVCVPAANSSSRCRPRQ